MANAVAPRPGWQGEATAVCSIRHVPNPCGGPGGRGCTVIAFGDEVRVTSCCTIWSASTPSRAPSGSAVGRLTALPAKWTGVVHGRSFNVMKSHLTSTWAGRMLRSAVVSLHQRLAVQDHAGLDRPTSNRVLACRVPVVLWKRNNNRARRFAPRSSYPTGCRHSRPKVTGVSARRPEWSPSASLMAPPCWAYGFRRFCTCRKNPRKAKCPL